jgi:hypothetical protein
MDANEMGDSLKRESASAALSRSRLKLGSVGIVTTLVYLWLAVLGSGGFAIFFNHPARTVLVVASMVMASAAFFSDANLSPGEREDRSNRWIFLPLLVIGLLSAFLPAYTERKGWWILDGDTVRWLGVFLFVAGWRAADLAHLHPRAPIQRTGGHPART